MTGYSRLVAAYTLDVVAPLALPDGERAEAHGFGWHGLILPRPSGIPYQVSLVFSGSGARRADVAADPPAQVSIWSALVRRWGDPARRPTRTRTVTAQRPEEEPMYTATMQTISAEQGGQMREQAAAWRRAQQARSAVQARPARIPFAVIARLARNARSQAGQKQLHGPAAA
jgi:hypothetical protein